MNRGFAITSYNDPVWTEEFERYQRNQQLDSLNKEILKTPNELRDKCKELTEFKFNGSLHDDDDDDRLYFVSNFCTGRTKLSKLVGRIVPVNEKHIHWRNVAKKQNLKDAYAKAIGVNENSNSLNEDAWKNKIMDYCKRFDWNREIRSLKNGELLVARSFCEEE